MGLSQLFLKMAELLRGEIHSEEGPLRSHLNPKVRRVVAVLGCKGIFPRDIQGYRISGYYLTCFFCGFEKCGRFSFRVGVEKSFVSTTFRQLLVSSPI